MNKRRMSTLVFVVSCAACLLALPTISANENKAKSAAVQPPSLTRALPEPGSARAGTTASRLSCSVCIQHPVGDDAFNLVEQRLEIQRPVQTFVGAEAQRFGAQPADGPRRHLQQSWPQRLRRVPCFLDRIAELASIWSRVRSSDLFGPPGLKRLIAVLGDRGALAPPAGLLAILERHLPRRHSDLALPTAVIATELLSGDPVILEDGELRRNVLASAAIPGLFPPVEIGGRTLADGGLAAQVPVLQALELGASSVVVLDTGYPCALTELPRGLIPNVVHAASLVLRSQSTAALRAGGSRATVLYLPSPCPLGVAPWDFTRWAFLIEQGHRCSARFLAALHDVGPGVHGHPHLHEGGACEASERRARAPAPAGGPPPEPLSVPSSS